MKKQELKYWLAWNRIKEIGPVRFLKLCQHFSSLEDAWYSNIRKPEIKTMLNIKEETLSKIELDKTLINPDDELSLLEEKGIKAITIKEEGYPSILKDIYSPPPIIYYQGNFLSIMKESEGLAVVGSRMPTFYGRKVAKELSNEIAKAGYVVISGLARGIDTNAHLGALEACGKTIAVLGSGLDRIYPTENNKLAQRIINENGSIISEFPLLTRPEKNNFPRRNRIISGLSLGTIVVEAAEKSGALITADFALEQGKEVFAVPGSIYSFLSTGCHNLIKQGAKLINNCQDIFVELPDSNPLILENKANIENQRESFIDKLTPYELKLLEFISIEPLHIDEITELSAIPYGKVFEALLSLELKGIIKEVEGKRYIRI